jgi:hypothetical protein
MVYLAYDQTCFRSQIKQEHDVACDKKWIGSIASWIGVTYQAKYQSIHIFDMTNDFNVC